MTVFPRPSRTSDQSEQPRRTGAVDNGLLEVVEFITPSDHQGWSSTRRRSERVPSATNGVRLLKRGHGNLLETDWSAYAASFTSLGNPVRLELLRHILNGTHRTADLAAMDHLGTTGQLHHHLQQLVAAGWVHQAGRGSYEIPVARIVPLLACLATGAEAIARRRKKSRRDAGEDDDYSL